MSTPTGQPDRVLALAVLVFQFLTNLIWPAVAVVVAVITIPSTARALAGQDTKLTLTVAATVSVAINVALASALIAYIRRDREHRRQLGVAAAERSPGFRAFLRRRDEVHEVVLPKDGPQALSTGGPPPPPNPQDHER